MSKHAHLVYECITCFDTESYKYIIIITELVYCELFDYLKRGMYMKRRLRKFSVILSVVIFATAAMSACKKDDISEIDRTFEYIRTETQTTSQHATGEQEDTTTEKESTVKESTKETTKQTQEETTTKKQLTGAAVYFEDKKSVFNTLPSFITLLR